MAFTAVLGRCGVASGSMALGELRRHRQRPDSARSGLRQTTGLAHMHAPQRHCRTTSFVVRAARVAALLWRHSGRSGSGPAENSVRSSDSLSERRRRAVSSAADTRLPRRTGRRDGAAGGCYRSAALRLFGSGSRGCLAVGRSGRVVDKRGRVYRSAGGDLKGGRCRALADFGALCTCLVWRWRLPVRSLPRRELRHPSRVSLGRCPSPPTRIRSALPTISWYRRI